MDMYLSRALVTDTTGLVRRPDGSVPGPAQVSHSDTEHCQEGRNHILPCLKVPY